MNKLSYALPHLAQVPPYPLVNASAQSPTVIKLDQNENPYPPAPLVLQTLRDSAERSARLYPDADCAELRGLLAERHGVSRDMIVCGSGSSDLIVSLFRTFVGPRRSIAMPYPTFALYETAAAASDASVVRVQTDGDFAVDTSALLNADAPVIALVNPNAPTGRLLPLHAVEAIVSSASRLVVIDEAYMDFAGEAHSAVPLALRYDNVVVLRTFSKAFALSGARVGYAIGHPDLIEAFLKTKAIYNISGISQSLAAAAIQDEPYMKRTVTAINAARDRFASALEQLGFRVVPSAANFILCAPPLRDQAPAAPALVRKLAEHGFAIRYFDSPRLADKVRISIGTGEQMDALAALLRKWYRD